MSRIGALAATLAVLSLPLGVALFEAWSFSDRTRNNGRLVSSGVDREYWLHVPESYRGNEPAPVVITLHGGAGWPTQQRDLSGWNEIADRHGFIAVYPAGLDVGGMTGWRAFRPGPEIEEDVRFISDLIDHLEESYFIDPTRIYVNGLSNGGSMSWVLSCALADRIAAVGMVAAAHMLPWTWCSETRPMPMIAFHGTQDTAAPYEGGRTWVSPQTVPDIEERTAQWARRNRCQPEATDIRIAPDVIRRVYGGCADGAPVELYTIEGGGHTWPGGEALPEWFLGATTKSIDASVLMWDLFQAHRNPRAEVSSIPGS